ncbi:sec-independent translocase [Brevundimonas sp. SH203]|uniref:Sec-independent protein translocase protein TatB n=1 Tax=Brevundimonas sp. SH203 TaxID=345167 RepID=UPI0009CB6D18|nr:Sec-independent protein translocase protein TatB [Brevundimonas sp. SH203]GAW39863.1 sec-independent translocase [Brevundimonas sp. SH203]
MGGLGPGIGGFELVVIGLVALLVVGPKDLPILMRRVGQMVAKARAMANEFRTSFDEMARQSELDELRKEVEALRTGQGAMYPLGAEADAAFKDINAGLNAPTTATPLPAPEAPVMTPAVDEWPDAAASGEPAAAPAPKRKPAVKKADAAPAAVAKTKTPKAPSAKTTAAKPAETKTRTAAAGAAKPKVARKKAVDL